MSLFKPPLEKKVRSALDSSQQNVSRRSQFRLWLLSGVAATVVLASMALFYSPHAETTPPPSINAVGSPSLDPRAISLPNFTDLVQRVKPAVVSVRVKADATPRLTSDNPAVNPFEGTPFERFFNQRPNGGQQWETPNQHRYVSGQGSGFFISADGYIVTNNHVVEKAVQVEVVMDDGKELKAKVVGTDPTTDLALLKVTDAGRFPFVKLAQDKPKIGEWVVAMGNPFGLGGTVTAGIVSAENRDIGSGPYDYIQIDAAVNRGNSGGPTFNMNGEVVGVNTAIYSPSGGSVGIAFDIPAATVATVVPQLEKNGRIERGWLGVQIQPISKEIADSLGLKEAKGALVAEPQVCSPAAKAGLRTGDVLTRVAGTQISDARDLARKVAAIKPGTRASVTIMRDGKSDDINVTIGQQPNQPIRRSSNDNSGTEGLGRLGLEVAPASAVVGAGSQGLAIVSVDAGSAAAELGLARGDVILKAGGKTPLGLEDLQRAMAEARDAGKGHVLALVKRSNSERYIALPVAVG